MYPPIPGAMDAPLVIIEINCVTIHVSYTSYRHFLFIGRLLPDIIGKIALVKKSTSRHILKFRRITSIFRALVEWAFLSLRRYCGTF